MVQIFFSFANKGNAITKQLISIFSQLKVTIILHTKCKLTHNPDQTETATYNPLKHQVEVSLFPVVFYF